MANDNNTNYRIQRPETRLPLIQQNAPAIRTIGPRVIRDAAGASAINTIIKKTNENVTSHASLTNDSELLFTMLASTKYRITGNIFFDTTAAADFQYSLIGPPSPVTVRIVRSHLIPGTAAYVVAVEINYPGAIAVVGTGTTGGHITLDIIVFNGINPGTFAFQWAQNTSDAGNTTVFAGSWLEYQATN